MLSCSPSAFDGLIQANERSHRAYWFKTTRAARNFYPDCFILIPHSYIKNNNSDNGHFYYDRIRSRSTLKLLTSPYPVCRLLWFDFKFTEALHTPQSWFLLNSTRGSYRKRQLWIDSFKIALLLHTWSFIWVLYDSLKDTFFVGIQESVVYKFFFYYKIRF